MISAVSPFATDVGVWAAVLVAVLGAIRAIVVPLRGGLRVIDQIKDELTTNGGGSTKDMVRHIQRTVGEIQEEQAQVKRRLAVLEQERLAEQVGLGQGKNP